MAARAEFEARVTTSDGGKVSDLTKRAARKGNVQAQKALKAKVKAPPELAHILVWYRGIRNQTARGQRFEPIQFSEIQAYKELHQLDMTSFEVDMLVLCDREWQDVQPAPEPPKVPPRK